ADGTVAVTGQHCELLLGKARQHALRGDHFQLLKGGSFLVADWCALYDPAVQHLIRFAIDGETPSAAVRRLTTGLGQQQASLRSRRKPPSPPAFLTDGIVIKGRIEAEKRQFESILPAGLAVTTASVAPVARQHGNNVVREVQRSGVVEILDDNLH